MLGTAVDETELRGNSVDNNPANDISAGAIKLIFSNKDERPSAFSPSPQTITATSSQLSFNDTMDISFDLW